MKTLSSVLLMLVASASPSWAQARQQMAKPELPPAEEPQIAMFDVADIVQSAAERQGEWAELDQASRLAALRERGEQLAEVLAEFVQPSLFEGREEIRILDNKTLIGALRSAQRDWIQEQLDRLRVSPNEMILIEWRSARVSEELVRQLGLSPKQHFVDDLPGLLESLQSHAADLLLAPRVMVFNGQRFSIQVTNQVAYVKAYEVHESVEPTGARLVDPVVDVIEDGLLFDGRALVVDDGQIAMSFKITHSELERPILTEETDHGPIGLPIVHIRSIESRTVLASKQAMIHLTTESDGQVLLEILRVEIVN